MNKLDGYYQQNMVDGHRCQETTHEFEQRVDSDRLRRKLAAIEKKLDTIIEFLEIEND